MTTITIVFQASKRLVRKIFSPAFQLTDFQSISLSQLAYTSKSSFSLDSAMASRFLIPSSVSV